MNELLLSRAIEGFLLHKAAEGRSPRTLSDYRNSLGKLLAHAGDVPLGALGVPPLRAFFAFLNDSYTTTPAGCAPRPRQALSPKTVKNIHAAVSSLFTWAIDEGLVAAPNPMRRIQRPKAEPPPIDPFTKDEVVALLRATRETKPWRTRPTVRSQRPTALRDYAILLALLDCGLRASELCALTLADYDETTGHLIVRKGKGNKGRLLRVEQPTRRALWKYRVSRPATLPPEAPLFASTNGQTLPMSRHALLRILHRCGQRALVANVHPHRFRHTFAIEFLRNGGDIYTLQQMLGHTSLDMVKRYLKIVQTDLDNQHKSASPVANWRL